MPKYYMFSKIKSSGFTLVELMIVLTIIMILWGLSLFPYGYYLQRWYIERAGDWIAQEWIIAHRAIRWWIEFDPITGNHARFLFVFEKWTSEIESYLLSWSLIPDINTLPTNPNIIKKYKTFSMEKGIKILGFSGSLIAMGNKIGYLITPPNGEGSFFTGSSLLTLTWWEIVIWYPGATLYGGRMRSILLRPYLQ